MSPEITYQNGVAEIHVHDFADILSHGLGDVATPGRVQMMIKHRIIHPSRCPRTDFPKLRPHDLLTAYCAIELKMESGIHQWRTVGSIMGNHALVMQKSENVRLSPEWKEVINKLGLLGIDINKYPSLTPISK